MNIYAQSIMTFASAFDEPDTTAGANATYTAQMSKFNAFRQAKQLGINIANTRKAGISEQTNIEMAKLEAEASAKIAVAVSGTAGGTVDALSRDIATNAVNRSRFAKDQTDERIASDIAMQASVMSKGLAIKMPKVANANYAKMFAEGASIVGGKWLQDYSDGVLPMQQRESVIDGSAYTPTAVPDFDTTMNGRYY